MSARRNMPAASSAQVRGITVTATVLLSGSTYMLAHRLVAPNPTSINEIAVFVLGWFMWSVLVLVVGGYIALTLAAPPIQTLLANLALLSRYTIELELRVVSFVVVIGAATLLLLYAPIAWMRTVVALPPAMMCVMLAIELAGGWPARPAPQPGDYP